MCDCAKIYADSIHQKLIDKGYYDDEGQFDVTEQVDNLLLCYLISHLSDRMLLICISCRSLYVVHLLFEETFI